MPKGSSNGVPPTSSRPGSGPLGVCGVWQLPQATMVSIRYLPRSSGVCAGAPTDKAHTRSRVEAPSNRDTCKPPE